MMIDTLKESLWRQFGASITMLENAIIMWPDACWETDKKFFYNAYHVLVFLDYYLTIPAKKPASPLPFTFAESGNIPACAVDDLVPDRIYTKAELLDYLVQCRQKCYSVVAGLTEEQLAERWIEDFEDGMNYAMPEILLYNMRHVQHHAAQLNMMLRQKINDAPGWVSRADNA